MCPLSRRLKEKKYASVMVYLLLIALIVALPLIVFHIFDPFAYRISRTSPYDFPGSEWVCEEPEIYLRVDEETGIMNGYIMIDGERCAIDCAIDWGRLVLIHRSLGYGESVRESDHIFKGVCDCTEEEIRITVQQGYVFSGSYHAILLKRR